MRAVTLLKEGLLRTLGALTSRHALLLPREAGQERLLDVRCRYRVDGETLDVELLEPGPGRLTAELLGYQGHFPTRFLWRGHRLAYAGPSRLALRVTDGTVQLGKDVCGRAHLPWPGRRLAWRLTLQRGPERLTRSTGHYLAAPPTESVSRDYFEGDNYVDHAAQSAGEAGTILALLRRHGASGPVLEVGCATGGVLAALAAAGYEVRGIDLSAWAVERAEAVLGPGRCFAADVEADDLPAPVRAAAPYGALVLWSVFEHFRDPFAALDRLGRLVRPGGLLVLQATNADSLTRWLFGPDWEGHFDATHHGVEQVGVDSIRARFPGLGWDVEKLETHLAWTGSADPTHATLRDWYAGDARFRRLLAERGRGDLVLVVARRRGTP